MANNVEHLRTFYQIAKDAQEGKLINAEAIRTISSRTKIPVSSASVIVRDLKHMLRGERYRRRLSSPITEYFLDSIHHDYGSTGLRNALTALWAHIEYYEAASKTNSVTDRKIHARFTALLDPEISQNTARLLPAETLNLATPEYIWSAVQRFLNGDVQHAFGPSTDYDLIADDGRRFPPKAVFGVALSSALDGMQIGPKHFSAGESSACFRLLRAAGYQVVLKGELEEIQGREIELDQEWNEGTVRLISHLRRERAKGLSRAKKAQYRRLHKKLECERCGLDPIAHYGTEQAEVCIEVHHAQTHVSQMAEGHKTTLNELQCLCANCHRLVHRVLGEQKKNSQEP